MTICVHFHKFTCIFLHSMYTYDHTYTFTDSLVFSSTACRSTYDHAYAYTFTDSLVFSSTPCRSTYDHAYAYTFTNSLVFSSTPCRSTYDPIISEALNEHISTPYFIPASLTDQEMSWIFMGSPGPGANIHVSIPP